MPVDKLLSGASDLGEENVNGVASHHFQVSSLSSDAQSTLSTFLGVTVTSSGTIDIWRADNGNWPVKAKITGQFQNGESTSTAEVDWDVTNVDNATVQAPPQ